MRLPAALASLVLLAAATRADTPRPAIRTEEIPSPTAAAGASGPSLTVSSEGVVWMTWLERDEGVTTLKFSSYDAVTKAWTSARPVASGRDWFVNWADFPALTVGPGGRATAVWFVNNPKPAAAPAGHDHHGPGYHALISRSTDGGRSWSAPVPLTKESDSIEFVSLATLADGRVLAAWLDGRAKQRGGKAQALYARVLDASGPDVRVDPSVCDCCQTTLTALPDGTALLAYRGRTDEETRDIRVTRFRPGGWDPPRPLNHDDWRIAACPVNGPQFASDGGRVAVAWFTAADNDPRVAVSFSPDAGARFLLPVRANDVKPAGRVSTVLLHDSAILVTWVDVDGGLRLRRINPDFTAADKLRLTPEGAPRVRGFPRAALLRDYRGGNQPAEMLVAFTQEHVPGVKTLRVIVPEGELLEADKTCDCPQAFDQFRGFSIRGTIVSTQPAEKTVRVNHFEVPGIFPAGTRDLAIDPELLARITEPGRSFLGRIERRDGAWWIFDLRFIAGPPR